LWSSFPCARRQVTAASLQGRCAEQLISGLAALRAAAAASRAAATQQAAAASDAAAAEARALAAAAFAAETEHGVSEAQARPVEDQGGSAGGALASFALQRLHNRHSDAVAEAERLAKAHFAALQRVADAGQQVGSLVRPGLVISLLSSCARGAIKRGDKKRGEIKHGDQT
jgi:hypothetical protein